MTENEFLEEEKKKLFTIKIFGKTQKKMHGRISEWLLKDKEITEFKISAIEDLIQYRSLGAVEECREAVEIKKRITEIVNQQLIAGKDNYKEVYNCFYDIVKVIQANI